MKPFLRHVFFLWVMTVCAAVNVCANEPVTTLSVPLSPALSPSDDKQKQTADFVDSCAVFDHLIKACDSKPLCFYYLGPRKILADLDGNGFFSPGEPLLPDCSEFTVRLSSGGKCGNFTFSPEGYNENEHVCISPRSALKGTFEGKSVYLIDKNLNFKFGEYDDDAVIFASQPEVRFNEYIVCGGKNYRAVFDAQRWELHLTPRLITDEIKLSLVPCTIQPGSDSYAILFLKNEKTGQIISLSSGADPVGVSPGRYGVFNGMIFAGNNKNSVGHIGSNASANSVAFMQLNTDTVITIGAPATLTVTMSGKNGEYTLEKPQIRDGIGALYGCKTVNGIIQDSFDMAPELFLYEGEKQVKSFGKFQPG